MSLVGLRRWVTYSNVAVRVNFTVLYPGGFQSRVCHSVGKPSSQLRVVDIKFPELVGTGPVPDEEGAEHHGGKGHVLALHMPLLEKNTKTTVRQSQG